MLSRTEYLKLDKKIAPKSKEGQTLFLAFVVGGLICMIGQGVNDLFKLAIPSADEKLLGEITSTVMIFLGAALTGFGLYDRIGKFAGAGSIVPITGFANSVVSPAMEYRCEGVVFGVMCKMFVVAGPIIVSGVSSSIVVGLIYWIIGLLK
ncbi:MAG: stage V sporulation protein AC [Clostridia bacterium]|nr:stage V sporulation protein AC [Clostridia bacterium]MBR5987623.1 stage V sporulation protein AC [Clostridia bacterium]